jgi:hypothetical protein
MSKTFQEAILAARKLGIQYLWIDSLCIGEDETSYSIVATAKALRIFQLLKVLPNPSRQDAHEQRLYDDDAV